MNSANLSYRARRHVYPLLAALILAALLPGCGPGKTAEEIRVLRLSGNPDSARAQAVTALMERAGQMDVWLEFARSSLDLARTRDAGTEDELALMEGPLDYLVQAGLVTGAMQQFHKQDPPRVWRDAGRLVAIEVGRRINRMTAALASQTQTADLLEQMIIQQPPQTDGYGSDPTLRVRQAVDEYRDTSRQLLAEAVLLRRLIETLPETTTGSSSLLSGQLADAVGEWSQALDLEADYTHPLQARARDAFDAAFNRAVQDLTEVGHFLPRTILENGVLQ